MVRMCHVKTFALATVCMAGSALAADRAAITAVKAVSEGTAQQNSFTPSWALQSLSLRDINNVTDPSSDHAMFAVATCTCPGWDNGDFSNTANSDGVASHEGGAYPLGVQAADDFFLCEGNIYKLNSISASVFTNSQPGIFTKARLEIYRDCNGKPECKPIYILTDFTKDDFGTPYMMNAAYRVVTYHFPIAATNTDPINRSIYLHGGSYWISIIGISDGVKCAMGVMPDSTYWGSTETGIKGAVPQYRLGTTGNGCVRTNFVYDCNWIPTDCCFGCKDLNFVVCADECKILVDNGVAAGSRPGFGTANGSPSQFSAADTSSDSRSADDFVVPPCNTLSICYIEGCVFTNCDPTVFTGRYEIYGNTCRYPSYTFGGTTLCSGTATKVVDLGFDFITGTPAKPFHAYRLEFHNVNCTLPGGAQYWIAIGVVFNYNANFRSFFCFNFDCFRVCADGTTPNLIRWNPGMYLAPGAVTPPGGKTPWISVNHDFSFLIAGTLTHIGTSNSTGTCAADFNGDGKATVQDLFDFLSAWFAGCH